MQKSDETRAEMLHATSPLFNKRKLKLGTFGSNLSGAQTVSSIEGVLKVDWDTASTVGAMAEAMEFEAIVPVGRWRGFGGDTDFNRDSFESYTFAAGMAAQTKYPAVFATSHVSTIHPTMAAKQAITIDHISGGRFALNVVTGWYKAGMRRLNHFAIHADDLARPPLLRGHGAHGGWQCGDGRFTFA